MNRKLLLAWIKKHRWKSLLSVIGILLVAFVFGLTSPFPSQEISYSQDVQPILAAKCYACHGPDAADREAGLRLDKKVALFDTMESGNSVINLRRLSESELLRRITSDDPEYMMPPPDAPQPLEEGEIHLLQAWVAAGVPWENHWAYEPLGDIGQPKLSSTAWRNNPIDHFIGAEHKKRGLKHSKEADKRTLIRRLSFDLLGLPPSYEEVEAFVKDASENAYEQLVDRYLASPRYGERWARHWLDVAHYGETHGYDKDQRRPNAWPYRDYVISAFNKDLPYGRFVEDQLAGDILDPDDPQSTVALGFLAAGPWDLVGHVEVKDGSVDKRIVRNLDRDDYVTQTISSFTGLTVHCARCHDHKFDPIKQEDYYGLQAVFAGIDRADRPFDPDPAIHQKRILLLNQKETLEASFEGLEAKLGEKEVLEVKKVFQEQQKTWRKLQQLKQPPSPNFGYHSKIEQSKDVRKWIEVDLGEEFSLEKIVLVPTNVGIGMTMPGYGFPLRFTVEVSTVPSFKDAVAVADYRGIDHLRRTDKPFDISFDPVLARYVRITAYRLWKGRGQDHFFSLTELQAFSGGENVARGKKVKASDQLGLTKWAPKYLTDGFGRYRFIQGEALPPAKQRTVDKEEKIYAALLAKEDAIRERGLIGKDRKAYKTVKEGLDRVEEKLAELPQPKYIYAAATKFDPMFRFAPADSIRPIFLLNRGDTEQPLREVTPSAIATFEGLSKRFELPEGHGEGERRAALAKWLTDEQNAFTWRSIVNRVWHYHFGKGIVPTANDFGKMGTPPSHPELLDYLAQEFLAHGQSLKWLHKLILTSATYKQATANIPKNARIDSENRFLWRANRRQLEAEAIWDGVLATSGKLDLTMGGPSFDAFRFEDDHSPRYVYKDYNAFDPSSFRRAIYRTIVRSVPDPFMTTLDCADPSQSVPVRNETVTALQALSALNNPFMVRQAAFFAERLEKEAAGITSQVARAVEIALQRKATPSESEALGNYAEKHGLAAACRLIFAMNEFLYVD